MKRIWPGLSLAVTMCWLTACATAVTAPVPAVTPNPAANPAATAGGLRSFNELIRDAKTLPGLFRLYQREERIWIELEPKHFQENYLLAFTLNQGLGERGLYGHFMWDEYVVGFERVGNQVHMLARNVRFHTQPNTPQARAAAHSFSPSLLAAAPVLSQPHPERQSILIDASAWFLSDIPQATTRLEATFRIPYAFDARNSQVQRVRSTADMAAVQVRAHFYTPRLPVLTPNANLPAPLPNPPRTLEDPRSLFLGFHYSLASLPDADYRPRNADDRLGHFVTRRWNYSNERATDTREFFINRWRLQKKEAQATLSEPIKPITFWIDRNVPEQYRATISAGILEWNKAFERLGYQKAIRVELQPENAEFDLAEVRYASVRWYLDADEGGLARGPIVTDPRSGEIIDADITISQSWARLIRRMAVQWVPAAPQLTGRQSHSWCEYAQTAIEEMAFALDLLEARGELTPDSPEAEALILAALKDVVMHEVGHALGLRHNFRASTVYPLNQIADPSFTRLHGVSGSVMDYNPINLAPRGLPQGEYFMSTLGPYDYWAIEYAYVNATPDQEAAVLQRIAARSTEPLLAYGADDEAGGFTDGYDPSVHRFDLGSDGLAYARRRLTLGKELLERLQQPTAAWRDAPGERLRRGVRSALGQMSGAANLALKYIGGIQYYRDRSNSPRANFIPVPLNQQRAALQLLHDDIFSSAALTLSADFIARLAPDNFESGFTPPELPGLPYTVFDLQRRLLERAMSDATAVRLIESATMTSASLGLADLYRSLRSAIWSELENEQDITLSRRNLQREHVRRLAALLLRPTQNTLADARALARLEAQALAHSLAKKKNKPNPGLSTEARAHLHESLSTLEEALRAPLIRSGA